MNVRNQVVETLVDEHDLNEINMISSSKIRSHKNHKVKIKQTSILKNGVIYGANAAGKSNLVEFFDFFKWTLYNPLIQIRPPHDEAFLKYRLIRLYDIPRLALV